MFYPSSNPLMTPKMVSSWLFLHFLARSSTVFDGVWRGFVPKFVPLFEGPVSVPMTLHVMNPSIVDIWGLGKLYSLPS